MPPLMPPWIDDPGICLAGRGRRDHYANMRKGDWRVREDDFDSMVRTIAVERRMFDNIRKAMAFILAFHLPIAGLPLMPLLRF